MPPYPPSCPHHAHTALPISMPPCPHPHPHSMPTQITPCPHLHPHSMPTFPFLPPCPHHAHTSIPTIGQIGICAAESLCLELSSEVCNNSNLLKCSHELCGRALTCLGRSSTSQTASSPARCISAHAIWAWGSPSTLPATPSSHTS